VEPATVSLRLLLIVAVGAAACALAAPAAAAQLEPGDIVVVDPEVPPLGRALLFTVDPETGGRTVIADFGTGSPNAVAVEADGDVLVTDTDAGTDPSGGATEWGALYRLRFDASGLTRTIVTDFGEGPGTGRNPRAVTVDEDGQILVVNGNGGTGNRAVLVRVDPGTGARTVVSDFGNSAQGSLGVEPRGVAVDANGQIFVIDAQAGTSGLGELVRVDPKTGARTPVSNFGAGTPPGSNPVAVAVESSGQVLVADEGHPSTTPRGLLFRVDPQTGTRTVLSDLNTGANTGQEPAGIAVEADGRILVVDKHAGALNRGMLFRVDPRSGDRELLSDFGAGENAGGDPLAVAVVPPQHGTLVVVDEVVNDNGGTATAGDWTMTVAGTSPAPATFPGAAAPGTTVTLDPGSYSVSATGPAGYTTTLSPTCAGTVGPGETRTCTITHDDRPATLVVVVDVVNDDGGTAVASDWTVAVTGANPVPASFPGAAAPGTAVTLDAGPYSVAQSGPTGYTASLSADCAGTAVIGQTRTCTIVNDDDFVAVISVSASPGIDFGSVAVGATPTATGSLVVMANVPYTISVGREAFAGGDIPLAVSLLDPIAGRGEAIGIPIESSSVVGTRSTGDAAHDWMPVYTLGPVPLRRAGAATSTVTYTVVAQ
jgi:sugar lactone lactonase YvrE